jgi:hypothetical protein
VWQPREQQVILLACGLCFRPIDDYRAVPVAGLCDREELASRREIRSTSAAKAAALDDLDQVHRSVCRQRPVDALVVA